MRTLLLDTDILCFQHAAVGEYKIDWDGDRQVDQIPLDFDQVTDGIDRTISEWRRALKADEVIVCLSCPSSENWRLDVFPAYKANRKGAVRPLYLAAAKEYAAKEYPSYERPRLEADDIMGILSTHSRLVKGERIIVSEDKDLQGVPGLLFNPRKDAKVRRIDADLADRFHLYQSVIGDSTDGYPGAPGVGPAKAAWILDREEPPRWSEVVDAFVAALARRENRSVTREEAHRAALVQARCARILRAEDYNFKTKEVILWEPK